MGRADKDLAFMLQYENIAWYESGTVNILDRRIYPVRIEFVVCKKHEEVATAIADMVTQSAGPYSAAAMGMSLAAYEARDFGSVEFAEYMTKAAYTLSHARPTTVMRMRIVTAGCLEVALQAKQEGKAADMAIRDFTVANLEKRYRKVGKNAEYLVDLFPKKCTVMTQCFAETIVGQMLRIARERGHEVKVICPETRPYFQGSRLTASVAQDMGYDVTVITDNMPAYTMQTKQVDIFTSAADVISMDGHVVNKVGTFQIAIVAKYHGIPFYVTGSPDRGHETIKSVEIEERDGDFCLQAMGIQTAMEGVKGYYPSFDPTPPHLVSAVVTDRGIFSPYNLNSYYEDNEADEFE
jgi:methylthioribose-1-phosphate isomerase